MPLYAKESQERLAYWQPSFPLSFTSALGTLGMNHNGLECDAGWLKGEVPSSVEEGAARPSEPSQRRLP